MTLTWGQEVEVLSPRVKTCKSFTFPTGHISFSIYVNFPGDVTWLRYRDPIVLVGHFFEMSKLVRFIDRAPFHIYFKFNC